MAWIWAIGCGGTPPTPADTGGWTPQTGWSNDEVPTVEVLVDGLDEPRGIARIEDSLLIAERGGGRVLRLADGSLEELATGLDEPYMLATDGQVVVVTLRAGGGLARIEADGTSTVIAGGEVPGRVVVADAAAWWIDEGDGADGAVWRVDLTDDDAATVLTDLDAPRGLSMIGDMLLVAESGANRVLGYTPADGNIEEVVGFEDAPMDVVVVDDAVFVTTRSSRWPYPGWVHSDEIGFDSPLSYSPPEPDRVGADAGYVYWASKQSITRVARAGGTYEILAMVTAPGDFVVTDQQLIWTDRDRGSVLAVDLP